MPSPTSWAIAGAHPSRRSGNYFRGTTACQSCLLAAGRHQELLYLLELDRHPRWHERRYGVQALLVMGKKAEAIEYAEASRGLSQSDSAIDLACEEILISSGMHEEAYRRYGLCAPTSGSNLAHFRAAAGFLRDWLARKTGAKHL